MNQRFEDYIKDYDSHILEELGFKECGTIRINAFRFVYSVIHQEDAYEISTIRALDYGK